MFQITANGQFAKTLGSRTTTLASCAVACSEGGAPMDRRTLDGFTMRAAPLASLDAWLATAPAHRHCREPLWLAKRSRMTFSFTTTGRLDRREELQ